MNNFHKFLNLFLNFESFITFKMYFQTSRTYLLNNCLELKFSKTPNISVFLSRLVEFLMNMKTFIFLIHKSHKLKKQNKPIKQKIKSIT